MSEPNPETPRFPELSPDQLAEVEAIVEMSEQILTDPDLLVADEDQPDFQIGPSPVTPYHTEVDSDRMYWNESEWPQIAGLMAERFGVPADAILDSRPETEVVVLAERPEGSATVLLGISRTTDEVEPGQVPYALVVTTREIGWQPSL